MKLKLWLCCLLAVPGMAFGQDHPLVTAYPGSSIARRDVKEFDEYELVTGALRSGTPAASAHLEGKLTGIDYLYPVERSTLEVLRNYEEALKRAGFQILFSCAQRECGSGSIRPWGLGILQAALPFGEMRYLAAKLTRTEGDAYVALHVKQTGRGKSDHHAYLVVIETKPMQQGMVKVDAAALVGELTAVGHAAVYGIYFDTAKWDIKPESEKALGEIVKLLHGSSNLKLHVVGHTDNVGNAAANLDLSRKRADSVVKALVAAGIAAARLDSAGVGQYSPVATNRTEAGRAKNRRVELVEQ